MKPVFSFSPFRLLAYTVVLLAMGCGTGYRYEDLASMDGYDGGEELRMAKTEGESQENTSETIQRKIIKEGGLRFETSNASETRKSILQLTEAYKAYVSRDFVDAHGDVTEYTLSIRVPSEHFEELMEKISGNAGKVDYKNSSARDVTEEFIDVEARISTKKELENRYLQLLSKANTVQEILQLEKEIGNLRSEIEAIEGRLNYLKNQTALSTINVSFYEKNKEAGFMPSFPEAFKKGWANLQYFLLGLTTLWPFILLIAGIIYFAVRAKKRNG